MSAERLNDRGGATSSASSGESREPDAQSNKPLISLVVPAFNEASILDENLKRLCDYMRSLEADYCWELVFVNDGSTDATGEIADAFAKTRDNVRVYHHPTNFGLGQAFRCAFGQCRGDYVVTMDVDLSYSPEHIGALLRKVRETKAKVVLASPYMKEGRISNVPWLRKTLSIWANRFLSVLAHGHLSTLTCMVRAYDGPFIRALNHRATGMEVMPETVYKTMILRGRIEQIPAHLDWGAQRASGVQRRSSMKVLRHMFATIVSGFVFRPFMFFIAPGLLLFLFSLWVNFWMVVHFFEAYAELAGAIAPDRIGSAVARAYSQYPHTFIVGLLSLMLSVQLVGLGILALQSKQYFEEIFHLGTTVHHKQSLRTEEPERR